ncbi:MAG: hypothetical protein ABIJ34_09160 [archaeon]
MDLMLYDRMPWLEFIEGKAFFDAGKMGIFFPFGDAFRVNQSAFLIVGNKKVGKSSTMNALSNHFLMPSMVQDSPLLYNGTNNLELVQSSDEYSFHFQAKRAIHRIVHPVRAIMELLGENQQLDETINIADRTLHYMFYKYIECTSDRRELTHNLLDNILIHTVSWFPTFEQRVAYTKEIVAKYV